MTAYVADMSYFSGKMEAYLRYKGITYQRKLATSGTMISGRHLIPFFST